MLNWLNRYNYWAVRSDNTRAFLKRLDIIMVATLIIAFIIVLSVYQYKMYKPLEAPYSYFINAYISDKPVKVNESPFYEVNVKLGAVYQPTKCCNFKATKVDFTANKGKEIVLFINLMDYTSGTFRHPIKGGDMGKKTASYLKRLRTIVKSVNKDAEVWYVRGQELSSGEELASYEFRTECLLRSEESSKIINDGKCFDKFLVFSNKKTGKFRGNNAGLKYWVSKYCPGSNLQDLDQYVDANPEESHDWPITCLIDRKGYSRIRNDASTPEDAFYHTILKVSDQTLSLDQPMPNLGLSKADIPGFKEWLEGAMKNGNYY